LIVTTLAPVADFRADRQAGNAPFVVRFTDLSNGSPATWSWDFGDGTGSSEQNPSHIYMNEGAYNVQLTVSNQYGTDSVFLKDTSSATTTTKPSETPAAAATSAPLAEVTRTHVTSVPVTTRSPLSPGIAVFAALAGLLLIAVGKRR
jgi:PKD repeat protein